MTDESPPRDQEPAAPPAQPQSEQAPALDPGERADSIAPMSAPIVPLEHDAHSNSSSALGVETEMPAARRLSPPPKPRSVPPTAEQQPYFAAPGFVSPLTGALRPSRSDGISTELNAQKPTVDPSIERRSSPSLGTTSSGGAGRSSLGSLPPAAVFPKVSTRPPPTLPAGTSPSQYPWAVPATPDTVIMRPRTGAVGRPFEHVRAAGSSSPTSSRAPVLPPARRSAGEGTPFSLRSEAPDAAARHGQASVPADPGQPALPPLRRSEGLPPLDESGESPSARGAALPRALRESGPPGSARAGAKPRFVPQQLRKDTPAVAIQAMRIIAIGSDDGPTSLPARALNPSGDLAEPTATARQQAGTDQSPTQLPNVQEAAPAEQGQALPPALPDSALQEVPPIPEEVLEDASAPEALARQAEPLNELELYQLTGQPPDAALAEPIPDGEVATIDSQRGAATAPLEDLAATSVRKRPPPPKRVSVPSAAGESTSDGRIAAATATSERPAARPVAVASAPTETAPRQPPPAPSRVPRDSASRQATKPEAPERAESVSRKPDPPERKSETDAAVSEEKPKPRAATRRLWWDELFGEDFSRANPRLTDAQIDQEATFIEESLGMAPGAVVLDLGCGAGYHAVELASRGYGIVGYDLSLHQLSLAQEVAHERGQKLNFMQGDMRDMAFEEVFDSIYCWNTTFGYYEEEKNVQIAQRMFAALKPGGTLLLDVANRDFVAMNQPSSVWYEGDSCVCMDDMSVDFFTSRLRVKRSLILDDGRTRECHYSIRLYSLHELGRILHDIGFRVTEASGHPSTPGVFLGQSSPRILILAQRP